MIAIAGDEKEKVAASPLSEASLHVSLYGHALAPLDSLRYRLANKALRTTVAFGHAWAPSVGQPGYCGPPVGPRKKPPGTGRGARQRSAYAALLRGLQLQ